MTYLGAPRTASGSPSGGTSGSARVILSASEIQILRQVMFERGSDVLRPVSHPIIDETARVLKSHPEIRAITIEGHSSSDERDASGLAARRVAAVRAALIAQA